MGKAQELNKWIVAQIWRNTTTATQCNTLDPTKDSKREMERETEREKWKVIIAICERSEKKSMTIIIIKYKNQRKYIRLHTFTFAHCQTIHTFGNSSKTSCSKLENANRIHNSRNGFFFGFAKLQTEYYYTQSCDGRTFFAPKTSSTYFNHFLSLVLSPSHPLSHALTLSLAGLVCTWALVAIYVSLTLLLLHVTFFSFILLTITPYSLSFVMKLGIL